MDRFVVALQRLVLRHSGAILCGFALAAVPAAQFRIDTALENLMLRDDPDRLRNLEVKREFSNDEILVVAFELGRPFAAADLERLAALSERVADIDGVEEVIDLANVEDVRAEGDSLDASPLVDLDTVTADIERIRARVDGHPLYRRNLVSDDGRVLAMVVILEQRERAAQVNFRVSEALLATLAAADLPWPSHVSGYPYAEYDSYQLVTRDLALLTAAALAVVAIALLAVTRSARAVGLALVLVLWTEVVATAWFGLTDTPFTIVTAILPTVLLASTSTYAIYLLTLLQRCSQDLSPAHTLLATTARPVLLASTSTALGFASLRWMPVEPLVALGTGLCVGIVAAALGSLLLLPAAIHRFDVRLQPPAGRALDRLARVGIGWAEHPRTTLVSAALLAGAALLGISRLEVNSDPLSYWRGDSDHRRGADFVREHLAGTMPLNVLIRSDAPGGALEPELMRFADELVAALERTPHVDRTLSFLDYAELMDAALGDAPEPRRVLPSRALAAQYLLLYDAGGDPGDYRHYINHDRSALNVFVRVNDRSTRVVLGLRDRILELARRAPPGVAVEVLGTGLLFPKAMAGITRGMVQGLLTAAGLIGLVMLASLRSPTLGLVAAVPNLAPIAVCLGAMGWLGVPLSFATSIVGCAALGLAVDDTAHVLGHLRPGRTLDGVYRTVGRSLVATTAVLASGFTVIAWSEFLPVAQLGLATAATLIVALACDLVVLPSLLAWIGWPVRDLGAARLRYERHIPRGRGKASRLSTS